MRCFDGHDNGSENAGASGVAALEVLQVLRRRKKPGRKKPGPFGPGLIRRRWGHRRAPSRGKQLQAFVARLPDSGNQVRCNGATMRAAIRSGNAPADMPAMQGRQRSRRDTVANAVLGGVARSAARA